MCISYTNRLKSAPKAPKFLGDFGLLIRKPPLVLAAFGTRGGFLIKVTTDVSKSSKMRFEVNRRIPDETASKKHAAPPSRTFLT